MQRPWAARWVSVVLVLAAALASPPTLAACRVQQMEIPVRIVDRRPIATLVLNGTEVPMLLDSGAFYSFLTASAAAQLQLPLSELPYGLVIEGYTGRVAAKRAVVEKVGLRGAQLSQVEFVVGGNEIGAGIMGILGRNLLSFADTEYDLAHGAVRLTVPKGDCSDVNLAYWAGDAPVVVVPLVRGNSSKDSTIRVEVSINGNRDLAVLDTGAPRTSLALRTARRAGIAADAMTPAGRAGGAGEGRVASWMATVALFEVGGEKIRNSRLRVDDVSDYDQGALVGLDYFLSHRIYVSRLQRRVYITWNGNPICPQGEGTEKLYDTRHAATAPPPDANDADALARRGAAALAAGKADQALEDLNRASQLAPEVAEYRLARGRVHLERRDRPSALADLDEALRLDATLTEARLLRARLLFQSGKPEAAAADLLHLDQQLPPAANQRADMGRLYAQLNQVDAALKQYGLWLDSHPKDVERSSLLNSRCWLRTRHKLQLDLALADCQLAVRLDGEDAALRDSLGWVHLRLGSPADARKAFDAALKLKPSASSSYGRGLAYRALGDLPASQRDLAEARGLEPGIDARLRLLGLAELLGPEAQGAEPR